MAKRKMITIDDEKCNGCGNCVTACAEGALAIVDGKARVVKEQYCDGFGDCIGDCPTGALKVEDVEAAAFDLEATKDHLRQTRGEAAVGRMLAASEAHERGEHPGRAPAAAPAPGGCPGLRMRAPAPVDRAARPAATAAGVAQAIPSELQQWPVQLHLVQPGAPFFRNRELAVLSTCSPVASADIHWRFIRGRAVAVGCPKLDDTESYAGKLGRILAEPTIPKVIVVRMEVPCCGGLTAIVREALRLSGRADLQAEEVTVGLSGDILGTRPLTA